LPQQRGDEVPRARVSAQCAEGIVTVETDMTDIGTGSLHHHCADGGRDDGRTASSKVVGATRRFEHILASAGSGGQWGANCSTAGVYAACVKLREKVAQKRAGSTRPTASFADGRVAAAAIGAHGTGRVPRPTVQELVAEDTSSSSATSIEEDSSSRPSVAHFVEVGGRMPSPPRCASGACWRCAQSGRILNPLTARSAR
jgi:xanthine dehydrogenase YagR molybdenum-binding subunit